MSSQFEVGENVDCCTLIGDTPPRSYLWQSGVVLEVFPFPTPQHLARNVTYFIRTLSGKSEWFHNTMVAPLHAHSTPTLYLVHEDVNFLHPERSEWVVGKVTSCRLDSNDSSKKNYGIGYEGAWFLLPELSLAKLNTGTRTLEQ
jgi:hypothetical protein